MKSLWLDIVSGTEKGAGAAAARAVLGALSVPFGAAASGRKWLYDKGALLKRRASIPVISIGNITVGGTGKTPLVEHVSRGLRERGRSPAVVMRGYGAKHGGASDEAHVLCGNLGASSDGQTKAVPVIEDPDRFRGCEAAAGEYAADVAVLDDGFQHIQLERDLDVVALDATSPFGFGKLFPAGCLREMPEALERADVIVITRSDLPRAEEVQALDEAVRELAPEGLVMKAVFAPGRLETTGGVEGPALDRLEEAKVAAFCGIGNPFAFEQAIRRLVQARGGELVLAERFPDHYPFTLGELAEVACAAEAKEARFVLTTQKDAARIAQDAWPATAPPLYVLRGEFAFVERERAFWDLIELTLDRRSAPREHDAGHEAAVGDGAPPRAAQGEP
jgi:tetraacyldisaccharide 4'-kinase